MARRYHIKYNEFKTPNESLRSPYTIPKVRSSLPEDKTSAPSKNFLFCEQTKEFFASRDTGSRGSTHAGYCDGFSKQQIGSSVNEQKLTGNLEHLKGASNLLPTSVKETNAVSDSALVHVKQKKFQSSPEHALPVCCNPQLFNSLNPSLLPTTCHFCGLTGTLRCTQCKHVYYCSLECQRKDWQEHSIACKPVKHNTDTTADNEKSLDKTTIKANLLSADNSAAEDEGKKIMFPELNTLELKRSMKVQGTVTVFNNPNEFYVQVNSQEILNNISKLRVKLKDYDGVIQEDYIPSKGEVCVAKYSLDQTWYRVLIQDVDILKKRAKVLYIDYGNGENTPLYRIKRLHKDISVFPPCAIKCCVANVITPKKEWDPNWSSTVTPLLMGKCCTLTIVDVLIGEMTSFVVDVVLPDSDKHLHDILLEMGQSSKDMNNKDNSAAAMEKSTTQEKTIGGRDVVHNGCLIPQINSLSVGDAFFGMVAHIQTPGYFFCQLLEHGRKLAELQASLREYCDKIPAVLDFCPAVGDTCCAQFTEDSQWYRASVLSYASEKTVLVGYIDFGNFEILHLSRLRPIIPKLVELPVQAVKCTIAGIKPVSGSWSTEATSFMKSLVENRVVTITIMDKNENTFAVELIDTSVTPTINIRESLLEFGCAVEVDATVLTVLERSPGVLEEVNEMSIHTQWTTEEYPIDKTMSVRVLEVINPDLIYVVPTETKVDPQKLYGQMLQLADYCTSQNNRVFKPKVGEACCARFSGDDRWYRAVVLKVFVSEVKVAYADYGNVEILSLSRLLPITAPYLELPFQIFKCSLAGIKELDEKWSVSAIERLKALLLNECVIIMVKGVSENIHAVTVNKNYENNILNVADQLVIENLAKYSNSENQCAKKTKCCCTELMKQVARLEGILSFLLKDRFGEDKLPEITLLKS